jgi:hypothetical protein
VTKVLYLPINGEDPMVKVIDYLKEWGKMRFDFTAVPFQEAGCGDGCQRNHFLL